MVSLPQSQVTLTDFGYPINIYIYINSIWSFGISR